MTRRAPFEDLVENDLPPEERDRLRRVHDLLVAVGPPPELPPRLASAPTALERDDPVIEPVLPPRHRGRVFAIAIAFAVVGLILGFVGGRKSTTGFSAAFSVPMHSTAAARGANGELELASRDQSGNWPIRLKVSGLRELPKGGWYELYLSRHGRPVASCGTFRVHSGTATVRLNAPYNFKRFDGWMVTAHVPGHKRLAHTPLLTTGKFV